MVVIVQAQCGQCEMVSDVISNGSFSSGNTGFSTDLNLGTGFFCPLCPEGTYAVGSFAFFYHSDFTGQDHTNPPNGQFMIVNGTAQEGINVWCQQVAVIPNTNYTLRFWVRDVSTNSNPHPMGVLQAAFNGTQIGGTIIAEGGWQEHVVQWNSGELTEVEVCIQNYQSNSGGNDFGLDDISMTACTAITPLFSANAGPDIEICAGETATIGTPSQTGYNYSWSLPEFLNNPNIAQPTVNWQDDINQEISFSFYVYQDTAGLGCITQDEMILTIHPAASVTITGNNSFCEGEESTLSAEGQYNDIIWSNGSSEQIIQVDETGIYTATVSLGNCSETASFEVNEIALPEINLGPDIAICETVLPLSLSVPFPVQWYNGIESTSINVESSGIYWASIQNNGCFEIDSIEVAIDELLSPSLPESAVICDQQSVLLECSYTGIWNTGDISSSITVNEAGAYSIEVVNGACVAMAQTIVSAQESPIVSLPEIVNFCEGDQVIIEANSAQNASYLWNDGNPYPYQRIDEGGWHILEVTNQCGSAKDSTFAVVEYCDWGLYIPNAFSPNNDGFNDGWIIKGNKITNVKVFVYNRFGDLIWFTEQLEDPWFPSEDNIGIDAYTYRVEAINYFGEEIVYTGHIRLLR